MDLGVLERSPEAGDAEAVDGLVAGYLARELVGGRSGTEMSDYFTDVVRVYGEAGLWDQPRVRADSVVENHTAAHAQRYVATYKSTSTAMRVNVVEQGQEAISVAAGTES